ncbi:MAG: response regulator transcription factor [Bryobacteraceae bacterium]|nr:response regulator transcription factor [Bryobacteraceae bacterium]
MTTSDVLRLLLIDDDAELCSLLGSFLAPHPVELTASHNGRDGLQLALDGRFDLVILDVMLPVIDGLEVLRQLRKRSRVPVLMLTARTELADRMAGFQEGADDYLSKPFHPEELLARCQVLVRRASDATHDRPTTIEMGGLRLETALRQAYVTGDAVSLTGMEFDILEILARAAGRIVGRDEIWAALHQREPSPFERALDTHISNLRRKLGGRGAVAIRTVRSAGYLLAVTE